MDLNDYLKNVKAVITKRMIKFKETQPEHTTATVEASCRIAGASGARVIKMGKENWHLISDAGDEWAGMGLGPGGMELFCGALAASLGHLYLIYAALMDIPLEGIEIEVKGDIDAKPVLAPETTGEIPELKDFTYTVHIDSGAPAGNIEKLHEMAQRMCPLINTIRRQEKIERVMGNAK